MSLARIGRPRRRTVSLALAGAALLFALATTPWADALVRALAQPSAPLTALGSAKLRRALIRSDRLALLPPASSDDCAGAELGARPLAPEAMPSSLHAPSPWRDQGPPLVSLWVDPCRLRRLHKDRFKHGREFEEIGWVSWYEGGTLRFASPVGVRIHGGSTRQYEPYSYRLYFRSSYGAAAVPGALIDPAIVSGLAHVVVAKDVGVSRRLVPWRFVVAIVDEIGRRVGGVAPYSRPAWFSLGGAEPLLYTLSESVRDDFLIRRFGHADFEIQRSKDRDAPGAERQAQRTEITRVAALDAPLRQESVDGDYDLDAITRWYTTALLCATGDLFQATVVRDRTGRYAGGRWSVVHWDMDMSFVDPRRTPRFGRAGDVIPATLRGGDTNQYARAPWRMVLTRLLAEDPAYRARLAATVTRALNHQFTQADAAELLARQRRLAEQFELPDRRFLDDLETFFAQRPAKLFQQMELYLDVGPPQPVTVVAPPGSVRIDGFTAKLPHDGLYPRGLTVTVELEPEWRARFVGFRVDGAPRPGSDGRLELAIEAPTRIEALFDGAPGYGSRSTG